MGVPVAEPRKCPRYPCTGRCVQFARFGILQCIEGPKNYERDDERSGNPEPAAFGFHKGKLMYTTDSGEILLADVGFRDHQLQPAANRFPLNPCWIGRFPPSENGFLFARTSGEQTVERSLIRGT